MLTLTLFLSSTESAKSIKFTFDTFFSGPLLDMLDFLKFEGSKGGKGGGRCSYFFGNKGGGYKTLQ